jgi:hypothetical protein
MQKSSIAALTERQGITSVGATLNQFLFPPNCMHESLVLPHLDEEDEDLS